MNSYIAGQCSITACFFSLPLEYMHASCCSSTFSSVMAHSYCFQGQTFDHAVNHMHMHAYIMNRHACRCELVRLITGSYLAGPYIYGHVYSTVTKEASIQKDQARACMHGLALILHWQ